MIKSAMSFHLPKTMSAFFTDGDKPMTFWRTLQTFNITRIVVALVLLVYLSANVKNALQFSEFFNYPQTCSLYLLCAIIFTLLAAYCQRQYRLQIVVQILVDIGAISILYIGAGGAKSGLAVLFLFPLAGGAILASLPLAMLFVSIVTLILLGESGYQILQEASEATTVKAGLSGAAFFFSVFVINRLANRLIRQEDLANQRGKDLRVQLAINRMAVADMGDGLLVVGPDGTILMANPMAGRMLALSILDDGPRHKLSDFPALTPIAEAFFVWTATVNQYPSAAAQAASQATPYFAQSISDATSSDSPFLVTIKHTDDRRPSAVLMGARGHELAVHFKLRFAAVKTEDLSEYVAVIFLQDVSEIENQAQQLKLASMGRLTASIAHEVRNPLSSISYAATLLIEDATNPTHVRLLNIIEDNVARLNRMIEDILSLSRKVQRQTAPILLCPLVFDIAEEFQQMNVIKKGILQLMISTTDKYAVWFDPLHLREVLVNLLSNALRYASGGPNSIRLQVMTNAAGGLELHVQDDGNAIMPAVRSHLFEPFYTTSNKGTGLGLFLARELCLNNGAMLDYEYRHEVHEDLTGRFVIAFAVRGPI
ncbi:histidine kinase dimerization/phospho-acceptor domain-containing protein [Glaciimonas sp. CA11.2]|uniref:sensor histidine kinase n=2 Tax=Glaciimonas sp. CA11.2 TaxID=3048601 RepID=UPI002AB4AE01|nr:ATP-binding protein [Glaciimonas sp. CA11.2]MDY7545628.1 histidine kinase dimerization/phospho-acceptor domain-containing protein [Glaciimonas sp. CA11.2]MEB0162469.1 histidine kinase dimerization/phospho-acceptor domain-containing protein [Glaciimonas sp. CA11.2]